MEFRGFDILSEKSKTDIKETVNKLHNHIDFKKFIFSYIQRENKKTYMVLICVKCSHINLKEVRTIQKSKNIICFGCEKKNTTPLTYDRLKIEVENYGSLLNSYIFNGQYPTLNITCKCGREDSKSYRPSVAWLCRECNFKLSSDNQRTDIQEVFSWFAQCDAKPLFTEYDYKNAKTILNYICKCGNKSKTTFGYKKSGSYPICRSCTSLKGDKNPSWKEVKTNRCLKRFKHEYYWDNRVKRIFNNTCVISGVNGNKKVVAHHLNAYATYPEQALDFRNGICISKELHKEFHKTYDKYKGTCTVDNFADFYKLKTGKDFYELTNSTNYDIE
jgi:hypothetical protein